MMKKKSTQVRGEGCRAVELKGFRALQDVAKCCTQHFSRASESTITSRNVGLESATA
jgi:hypothetical protein